MSDTPPIRIPLSERLADFRRGPLSLLIWLLAVGVTGWLFTRRAQDFETIGIARTLQHEISAATTGQLETILVDLYEEVEQGQIVAKLNDEALTVEIRAASVAIERLQAELDARRAESARAGEQQQTDWAADLRRFQADEDDHRLDAMALRVTIDTDQVESERLALTLHRIEKLLEDDVVSREEYDNIRLKHDEVGKRIEINELLLAQTEQAWRDAQSRRMGFSESRPELEQTEITLAPLSAEIEEQALEVTRLEIMRRHNVLRAPTAGRVTAVLCRSGQAIVRGEPILLLTEKYASEILAFASEGMPGGVKANQPVMVARTREPLKVAQTVIKRIGPAVEQLPERLWTTTRPQYGRPFIIAALPNTIPGEGFLIRLTSEKQGVLDLL